MKPVTEKPTPSKPKQPVKVPMQTISDPALKKIFYILGALVVCALIAIGAAANFYSKTKEAAFQSHNLEAKIAQLKTPIYNQDFDFLTEQCGVTAYCASTETNQPALEMLKFLTIFHEKAGQQYRLFFEVSSNKNSPNTPPPPKLFCDAKDAQFYICQEITAAHPTDVIRAFQRSYGFISAGSIYTINIMVKPIAPLDDPKPIQMRAPASPLMRPFLPTPANPSLTAAQASLPLPTTPNPAPQAPPTPAQQQVKMTASH